MRRCCRQSSEVQYTMKTRFHSSIIKQLALVGGIPDAARLEIAELLGKHPVELYPFEGVEAVIAACLNRYDVKEAAEVADALTAFLYTVGASQQRPSELIASAEETLREEHGSVADKVAPFLRALAVSKNLLISFKATALYEDNENLLMDSRALVDIRPIFDPEATETIAAGALIYRLRMTYRSSNHQEANSIVLTARHDELVELESVIKRAREKAQTLSAATTFGPILETRK